MFFISKKRFREEVERQLSEKMEEQEYRTRLNQEFAHIHERISRLEDRVARLEGKKEDCYTAGLPY